MGIPIEVRRFDGPAGELHALAMPTRADVGLGVQVWAMRPTRPALVMGSAQRPEQFDRARLRTDGVDLATRRSGGGAVFIDPGETVWIDVVAPRDSAWWSAELAENFLIFGRLWRQALLELGVATELVETPPTNTAASRLACWAGLGWGEVTVGGSKLVGLSQRRTRWGSRVQAMAVVGGSSQRVLDYLAPADRTTLEGVFAADHVPALRAAAVDRASLEAAVIRQFMP